MTYAILHKNGSKIPALFALSGRSPQDGLRAYDFGARGGWCSVCLFVAVAM